MCMTYHIYIYNFIVSASKIGDLLVSAQIFYAKSLWYFCSYSNYETLDIGRKI